MRNGGKAVAVATKIVKVGLLAEAKVPGGIDYKIRGKRESALR